MNDSKSMPATKSAATRIELPIMKQLTSWLLEGDGCPHIPFGPGSVAAGDPLAKIFDGKGDPATVAKEMQQAVQNAKGG
jgi:hypothetical protein